MVFQMMTHLVNRYAATIVAKEEGQDLVEYALILVFISIAAIAALMALGPQIAAIYTQITQSLAA